jgi:hypothetical protein
MTGPIVIAPPSGGGYTTAPVASRVRAPTRREHRLAKAVPVGLRESHPCAPLLLVDCACRVDVDADPHTGIEWFEELHGLLAANELRELRDRDGGRAEPRRVAASGQNRYVGSRRDEVCPVHEDSTGDSTESQVWHR